MKLLAPSYAAASRFEQPERLPFRITAKGTSLKVLMDHPAAWAIVTEELPSAPLIVSAPIAQPFIANFTLCNLLEFGAITQHALDRIDAKLQALDMVR